MANKNKLTSFSRSNFLEFPDQAGLVIEHQGKTVAADQKKPNISLGRGEENDFPIESEYVSRRHAVISLRGDKFFLSDRSTNGTYIAIKGFETIFVHQDEAMLLGEGEIALGRPFKDKGPEVLRYSIGNPAGGIGEKK